MAYGKKWDLLSACLVETEDGVDLVSVDDMLTYYIPRPKTKRSLKHEIDAEVAQAVAANKRSPVTYTTVEALGIDVSQYGPPPKRGLGFRTEEDAEWSREVKRRDKHTCRACGAKGVPLHAHHIESYAWNRDLRLDLDNGVTLCIHCHKDFHDRYGRRNNTREQFERWLTTTYG